MSKKSVYCLTYLSIKSFLTVHEKKKNFYFQASAIKGKIIDSIFSNNFLEKIKKLESSDIYRLTT